MLYGGYMICFNVFKCLFDRLNNIIMKSLSTHYDGEPDNIIQHINMKIIFCEEHL